MAAASSRAGSIVTKTTPTCWSTSFSASRTSARFVGQTSGQCV
jgi:hypothetical protein